MPEEFLSPTRAAKELGVSGQTIRALIRAGRMEAVVFGSSDRKNYRIRRSEIERWLREQTVGRR